MDHERLGKQLIRALRGKRSQPWLSRRLGLRSNLVYRWEAGRAWPTAAQLFRACRIARVRPAERIQALLGEASGIGALDLETADGVSALLRELSSSTSVTALAKRLGRTRFVVSRWLSGKTDIRLLDLLAFVEVTTLRLLDFVAALVDPAELPYVASAWNRLQASRAAAYDAPWSHAVLRALELPAFREVREQHEAWVAARLRIDEAEVGRSLRLLARAGQIRRRKGRWEVLASKVVDTSVDVERRRALRAFWSRVAVERLERGAKGVHAFNVFTVADRDIPEVQRLHVEFFQRLRQLASQSAPGERVMLYCTQILALDGS